MKTGTRNERKASVSCSSFCLPCDYFLDRLVPSLLSFYSLFFFSIEIKWLTRSLFLSSLLLLLLFGRIFLFIYLHSFFFSCCCSVCWCVCVWRRLKTTEGLESLESLDILDLHGNQITALTGVSRLRTLRVLNLAANSLKKLPSLDGLLALEELNAKRNRISKIVPEVALAKRLERLYLSNNELRR